MKFDQHQTFSEAYVAGLRVVLGEGREVAGVRDVTSVGSSFGHANRSTLELSPYGFTVANPAACLIDCNARQPKISYIVGQWLWVMAGSDQLDRISFYNNRGRAFSDDGRTLPGAFGVRMRRSAGDQLARALGLLRSDSTTRRAVVHISESADGRQLGRDFPCALAIQLLVRDGQLEAITNMRSQSALMVLPYDAALFMTLHLWCAAALELPAGPHHWVANSFHLYEDEIALARQIVRDPPESNQVPSIGSHPQERLAALQAYESELRSAVLTGDRPAEAVPRPASLGSRDELHGLFAAVLEDHAIRRMRACGDAGLIKAE